MNQNVSNDVVTIIPFEAIHKQQMGKVRKKTKYPTHPRPDGCHLIAEQLQLHPNCEQPPTIPDPDRLLVILYDRRESDGPTTAGAKYTNLLCFPASVTICIIIF